MKVVNGQKKSEYSVRKWRDVACKQFKSVSNLKLDLAEWINLPEELDIVVGYIEPGHGAKGRQRWLNDDSDLTDLYQLYKGKKEIMLWCHSSACSERSRSRSPHDSGSSTKAKSSSKVAQSLISKRDQVDAIVQMLRDKHQGRFTSPQLNTWAHCIHMKTHASYDEPPDKPFFKARGSNKQSKSSELPPTAVCGTISPSKRINLRSQCMDQIEKWHQLFTKGIISKEQHEELVEKMWNDNKKF